MSKHVERNNIIHLDGYYRNPDKDEDKPLIAQLADDLTASGFTDAGPNITKITITNDALTYFIDKLICYYYNSEPSQTGNGAFGVFGTTIIGDGNSPAKYQPWDVNQTGKPTATTLDFGPTLDVTTEISGNLLEYDPTGMVGQRTKYINQNYDDANWNQKHWLYSPEQWGAIAGDAAEAFKATDAAPVSGQQPSGTWLGPNAELFSYLNPHPNQRVQDANGNIIGFLKKDPLGPNIKTGLSSSQSFHAAKAKSTDANTKGSPTAAWRLSIGYPGIATVAKLVYQNEFNKIKRLITSNSRGVTLFPENSDKSQGNIDAALQQYKEEVKSSGNLHHFWISTRMTDSFFPSNISPPQTAVGTLSLDLDNANNVTELQIGDTFSINLRKYSGAKGVGFPAEVLENFASGDVNIDSTTGGSLSVTENQSQTAFAGTRSVIITTQQTGELVDMIPPAKAGQSTATGINGSTTNTSDDNITIPPTLSGFHNTALTVRFLSTNEEYNTLGTGGTHNNGTSFTVEVNSSIKSLEAFRDNLVTQLNGSASGGFGGDAVYSINQISSSVIDYKGNVAGVDVGIHVFRVPRITGSYSNSGGTDGTTVNITGYPLAGNAKAEYTTGEGTVVNRVIANGNFRGLGANENLTETYATGYVHRVQLGGRSGAAFDGCNAGDKFTFDITGVPDEGSATPWSSPAKDLQVIWTAPSSFNIPQQMVMSMSSALKSDAYISKYMNVDVVGDAIILTYNTSSSAYMVRSLKRTATEGLGLFNIDSALWAATSAANSWETQPFGGETDTEAAVVGNYNLYSSFAGRTPPAYVVGTNPTIAKVFPAYASTDQNDQTAQYRTLGSMSDVLPDAIAVQDVPSLAAFGVTVKYTASTSIAYNPISISQQTQIEPIALADTSVKLSFPFARDLGTFANPINHNSSSVGVQYADQIVVDETTSVVDMTALDANGTQNGGQSDPLAAPLDTQDAGPFESSLASVMGGNTKYFSSYKQHIIGRANYGYEEDNGYTARGFVASGNRPGPQISFDSEKRGSHPNISNPGIEDNYRNFVYEVGSIPIISFENITDNSIGPIIFDTPSNAGGLSGPDGTEGYRIRFNVNRGEAIEDASPFIATRYLQGLDTGGAGSTSFEYLTVHIATEYQLKDDGTVTRPEGRDGVKVGELREPGFLGAIRPQYAGYMRTRIHNVNPYIQDTSLQDATFQQRRLGMVSTAGIVGYYDYPNSSITMSATDPTAKYNDRILGGLSTFYDGTVTVKPEFRYEERFMLGSSTELTADTPYNDGQLRMQQGWFKRTGKQQRDIAFSYPMSYLLTTTNHGLFLMLKDQASSFQDDDYAWFVVQRHVDATTGAPDVSSSTRPVHCVYQSSKPTVLFSDLSPFFTDKAIQDRTTSLFVQGLFDQYGTQLFDFEVSQMTNDEIKAFDIEEQSKFRRFIVREKDILKPWNRHVFAGLPERDSHAVLNVLEQLSLNEAGQLVIQFPNRLGSQRYFYTGAELDMIAFADGGAVGEGSIITSDRFSSTGTTDKRRLYKAGPSSASFGNGMRILYLAAGFGILNTDIDTTQLNS